MGRGAVVIALSTRRPVATLADMLAIQPVAGGGLCLTITLPGAEPVELHPSREELQRFVWAAEDSIAFAEELSR